MPRPQRRMFLSNRNQLRDIFGQQSAFCRIGHSPVHPRSLVVLTVGIVIAGLRAAELIASQQHWRAVRKHYGCEHGAANARAYIVDGLIIGPSLNAPIGGIVLAVTVLIIFSICLVMALNETRNVS